MNQKTKIKIGNKYLYTHIIKAGNIYIRIGTQPKISKYLIKNKLNPRYIILLPPIITQAGDNYTGEEYVLLNKLANNDLKPNIYIGYNKYVKYLFKRLKYSINQTFNDEKTKIINSNVIKKIFKSIALGQDTIYDLTEKIKIYCGISNIKIFYNNKLIYDWQLDNTSIDINNTILSLLKPYKKMTDSSEALTIIPLGTGNGFYANTSNFIIRYSNRNIWVDPMAEPFLGLKKIKLHWDNITDYFISHIHEDHIEGLSAVLKRASIYNTKINLITTNKIFSRLKKIFTFLFPDFLNLVNHINIIPNSTLPYYHGYLTARLNHHILKNGTLGLKVQYKNNIFALSGDTYYSEKLSKKYPNNISYDSSWYNDCHLIFHEAEYFKKKSIHTYFTEIKKLSKKINGKILIYHYSSNAKLFPQVQEYKKYIIKNSRITVK